MPQDDILAGELVGLLLDEFLLLRDFAGPFVHGPLEPFLLPDQRAGPPGEDAVGDGGDEGGHQQLEPPGLVEIGPHIDLQGQFFLRVPGAGDGPDDEPVFAARQGGIGGLMPVAVQAGPAFLETFQPVFVGVLPPGGRTEQGELEEDGPVAFVQPDLLQIGIPQLPVPDPDAGKPQRAVHRPGDRPGRVHGGEPFHLAEIEQAVGAPAGVVPVELGAGESVFPEIGRDAAAGRVQDVQPVFRADPDVPLGVLRQAAHAVVGEAVPGGEAFEGDMVAAAPDAVVHAVPVAAQPEAPVGGFDDAADHFPDARFGRVQLVGIQGGGEAAVFAAIPQVEGVQPFPAADPQHSGGVQARADAAARLVLERGRKYARREIIEIDAPVGADPEQAAVRIIIHGADEVQAGIARE